MNAKKIFSAMTVIAVLFFPPAGYAAHEYGPPLEQANSESKFIKKFTEALKSHNEAEMFSLITENIDSVPAEVEALLKEALRSQTGREEREAQFYVVERMTSVYRDVTGDVELLKSANKRIFESRLSTPVRLEPKGGVYIVETISTEKAHNIFTPDNIIIKKGETVRWVNNDDTTHLLASVLTSVGLGGLFSPRVEPGKSWEYRFDTPGEYYYICFIHKIMYGKVTVEE